MKLRPLAALSDPVITQGYEAVTARRAANGAPAIFTGNLLPIPKIHEQEALS